jgi:hypothetical protein
MRPVVMLDFAGYNVPDHTQVALEMYLLHGIPPGGFLQAVLTNDLHGAITKADYKNKDCLEDIVKWLFHCAPIDSHGSREKIATWMLDPSGTRKHYTEKIEKMYIWRSLRKAGHDELH